MFQAADGAAVFVAPVTGEKIEPGMRTLDQWSRREDQRGGILMRQGLISAWGIAWVLPVEPESMNQAL